MPKVVDHDQRRIEVLDAAFSLFAEQGYHGVSVRQISKSVGMTTGMLYHYFPSKPELFTALVAHIQSKQVILFSQTLRQIPNGQLALATFLETEKTSMQQLLSIALEFRKVHPEMNLRNLLVVYEDILQKHLNISPVAAAQLLTTILGQLIRGLLELPSPASESK